MSSKPSFRLDIEGLRGLSVLLVIFYHFKLENLDYEIIKGGFLGVDIFFIISGYIISKIIVDAQIRNFSLLTFYSRRIKRIIPLLSVVLICSIILLPLIFDSFLINKNLNAALAVSSGISNFYFWLTSTLYQFAEQNNIINLHFWSLSIEIQFYILFPILFIIFKKNQKIIIYFLLITFIASYLFVSKIYITHNFFNFYNSLSRAFEFSFGALIFFMTDIKKKVKKNLHFLLYITGYILLFYYIYHFNNEGRHPNPYTIIFLVSLALIIIFNDDNKLKNLKKYFGKIGTISYSLYLWHFPILLLGNNYFENYNDILKTLSILLCFLISIITYNIIENKFRVKKIKYSLLLFLLLILTIFFSKILFQENTKNTIYNLDNYHLADESLFYLRNKKKISFRKSKNIFSFKNDSLIFSPQFDIKNNKQKVLIVGDSHSKDLFNMFKTNENKFNEFEFARYGININDFENYRKDYFLKSKIFKNADYIFFSQRYKESDLKYLKELIEISNKNKKKLILFLKRPEFLNNDKKNRTILDKFYLENSKVINKEKMDRFLFKNLQNYQFEKVNHRIELLYGNSVKLINLYPLICDDLNKSCHSVTKRGEKVFYDYGHLTLKGSQFIGNLLYQSNFIEKYLQ